MEVVVEVLSLEPPPISTKVPNEEELSSSMAERRGREKGTWAVGMGGRVVDMPYWGRGRPAVEEVARGREVTMQDIGPPLRVLDNKLPLNMGVLPENV